MDCIRALGGCSLDFPNKSSSSWSFNALTSSKVKPVALKAATYFFTVFLDASAWAAMVINGRCWLYILSIFLILLMLIVKLAMLRKVSLPSKDGLFYSICYVFAVVNLPRNQVVSFARNGWSACAGLEWSRSSESPARELVFDEKLDTDDYAIMKKDCD